MPRTDLKIGLLLPFSGPAGIWTPSSEACALLAAAEINAQGGILGRPVQIVVGDIGVGAAEAAEEAAGLVEVEGVSAVVGMHPSDTRNAVMSAIGGRVPYIYTPQYEGGVDQVDVLAIGETADELMRPGISWLVENRHARRFLLVGNDYIWPRISHAAARRIVRDRGAHVVGDILLPIGERDYARTFDLIRRTSPDVVLMYLLGQEAIEFNRAFSEAGLGARHIRYSTATDETVVYGIGPDHLEEFYVTASYLANVRYRENDAFLEKYRTCFGTHAPMPNAFSESCYEGIHYIAQMAESYGGLRTCDVQRSRGDRMGFRGRRRTSRATADGRRLVHMAMANGVEFRHIASF
ncbi:substrate-binding domain-containing protein [Arenibaculum pallidiluteum]|uniref:substrate-binding domain-containing protein n=1 Tax=Arenibaculum pallidiluteum TaxID=2812559 RepID=UPI001A963D24|nr:substrate-binding domain-containing protein [Arenibaculum pallidiluteum]